MSALDIVIDAIEMILSERIVPGMRDTWKVEDLRGLVEGVVDDKRGIERRAAKIDQLVTLTY